MEATTASQPLSENTDGLTITHEIRGTSVEGVETVRSRHFTEADAVATLTRKSSQRTYRIVTGPEVTQLTPAQERALAAKNRHVNNTARRIGNLADWDVTPSGAFTVHGLSSVDAIALRDRCAERTNCTAGAFSGIGGANGETVRVLVDGKHWSASTWSTLPNRTLSQVLAEIYD